MKRQAWMYVAVSVAVIVMALVDQHLASAGKSTALLTPAVYPKVYVHLVGGMALFGLLHPLVEDYYHSEWLAAFQVAGMGFLYELLQWVNVRGPLLGGVFTFQEGVAVAVGAIILALWHGALAWQRGGGDFASVHPVYGGGSRGAGGRIRGRT